MPAGLITRRSEVQILSPLSFFSPRPATRITANVGRGVGSLRAEGKPMRRLKNLVAPLRRRFPNPLPAIFFFTTTSNANNRAFLEGKTRTKSNTFKADWRANQKRKMNPAKRLAFIGVLCIALLLTLSAAIESKTAATGAVISAPSQNTSQAYCSADWKCYGPSHKGFQRADCIWERVEACGANSTCPEGQTLLQACNKTCSSGVCNGCAPTCITITPTPAPRTLEEKEFCGAAIPEECAGERVFEKPIAQTILETFVSCKKYSKSGFGLFSCPPCGNLKLDNCQNLFFGIVWNAICVQEEESECGKPLECAAGFEKRERECEKETIEILQCCKKLV